MKKCSGLLSFTGHGLAGLSLMLSAAWVPLLPVSPAMAGDPPAQVVGPAAEPDGKSPTPESYGDSIDMRFAPLPSNTLNKVRAEDYFDQLHTVFPHFRCIIHRNRCKPHQGPFLPDMEVRNLQLGEFVNFINGSVPGIDIKADATFDPTNPLFVVTLTGADQPANAEAVKPVVVRVFSLSQAVAIQQGRRSEDRKAATNDVLSLIEAVKDMAPDGDSASLHVHEETESLIFKGTAPLADSVNETLNTLANNDASAQMINALNDQAARQTMVIDEQKKMIDELRQQLNAKAPATQPAR